MHGATSALGTPRIHYLHQEPPGHDQPAHHVSRKLLGMMVHATHHYVAQTTPQPALRSALPTTLRSFCRLEGAFNGPGVHSLAAARAPCASRFLPAYGRAGVVGEQRRPMRSATVALRAGSQVHSTAR